MARDEVYRIGSEAIRNACSIRKLVDWTWR